MRSTASGDPLPRPRVSLFLTSTLLVGLALVFVLDPDDDDDQPVLPVAASSAPAAPEAQAKPGPLRMAKDFRVRPRKGVRKRARTRYHLHESGPPVQASQRTRRGTNVSPHLCTPDCTVRLAAVDQVTSWTVFSPVMAPIPAIAPPPRVTRAPPAV